MNKSCKKTIKGGRGSGMRSVRHHGMRSGRARPNLANISGINGSIGVPKMGSSVQMGGNVLTDLAVPAVLLVANNTIGKNGKIALPTMSSSSSTKPTYNRSNRRTRRNFRR